MTINLLIPSVSRQRNFENNILIFNFTFSFARSFEDEKLCLIDI